MASKYNDSNAVIQVIGCVFNNPSILDFTDKYIITENDFTNDFHKVIFGAIYKLHELGAKVISLETISDYLSTRPKSNGIYKDNHGDEWINRVSDLATESTFDYYYNRLKKFSLLRAYDNYGIDVSNIYDPDNILDIKKKQTQEDILDNSTLEQLANIIDQKIEEIKSIYIENSINESAQGGEGIFDLLEGFKFSPEVGVPLYGNLINTVTRGARLKKFYVRSAATGIGKTRSMIADACYIGCNKIYDDIYGWINNGTAEPTLFIATEQDLGEIQTMMLAFLANVNEEHILNYRFEGDEEERVLEAARILQNSPIYVETIPDFSLQDIENCIKRNIRDRDVTYVFFDYIRTSMKILEEITRRSGGVRLREDNILFMLSLKLKDICNLYDVFIETSTQLNGGYVDSDTPDQNLLRGAKSIADACDYGAILLSVTQKDKESLETILSTNVFATPTIKLSIYKNRRGRYKGIYLWCSADLGTCRINPMFATTYDYEIVDINNTKILVENEKGAF